MSTTVNTWVDKLTMQPDPIIPPAAYMWGAPIASWPGIVSCGVIWEVWA
jgi:hypothetical protein